MRVSVVILALALNLLACDRARRDAPPSMTSTREGGTSIALAAAPSKMDFDAQVRPILQARCQPCHFAGGKMYQRLPFDRPETIKALGTKLFTRIEEEKERRVIRDFLSQP
ncbi:MAG TPA: hypothetical protein VIU10_10080 [Candidatus Udaeobacter sp.]